MAIKESLLLYFRDINYAYNDSTRLDALEKGLAKLEEVVRCKDCIVKQICRYKTDLGDNGFCSQGRGKDDEVDNL